MLQNLIPALKRSTHDSGSAFDVKKDVEEKDGPKGVKSNGPQRYRYQSAGQVRRMHERSERAAMRKVNRRRRRAFMDEQQSQANVKGQIAVLKRPEIATPALRDNVIRGLERKYDGPEMATEVIEHMTSLREEFVAAVDKHLPLKVDA